MAWNLGVEREPAGGTPEAKKPPPIREVIRVAEQDEGWGVPAQWE